MKGLYLALMDIAAYPGYKDKLYGQLKAFDDAGIAFEIISLGPEPSVVLTELDEGKRRRKILKRFAPFPLNNRIQFYAFAIKYIIKRKCEVLYIRHFLAGPLFVLFLLCVKFVRKDMIILSEVPTFPYDNIKEFAESLKARLLLIQDKLWRQLLRLFYNRIVSLGYADDIFSIQTISISNGIDVTQYKVNSTLRDSSSPLRIIGVGYLKEYHGFDRLIKAVKNSLLLNSRTPPIEFHIISPVTQSLIRLREEVLKAGLSSNIIFHGEQFGVNLDKLFDQCHIAVASLAWHRVNLKRHSNLKTREYMARGIPFIYAGFDDQLTDDFQYACRVPLDETSIDADVLFELANRALSDRTHSVKMRDYAAIHMNWSVAMAPVVDYLRGAWKHD